MLDYTKSTYAFSNGYEIGRTITVKFFTANLARVTTTIYTWAGEEKESFTCEVSQLYNHLPAWAR